MSGHDAGSVASGFVARKKLAILLILLLFTVFTITSAHSSPRTNKIPFPKVCKACHTTNPLASKHRKNVSSLSLKNTVIKKFENALAFVSLGSRGRGVGSVSEVYEVEKDGLSGAVSAERLLFRDRQGIRLISEMGRYPAKGSEIVFGTKAYRMWKNGRQWDMRNVVSINGIAVAGDVFISEAFVKKTGTPGNSRPQNRTVARENSNGNKPEVAFYDEKDGEEFLISPSKKEPIIIDEGNSCKVTSYFGELTVNHIFKGRSRITVHEVSFAAYPGISFQEAFNVPFSEVKGNIMKYLGGYDGNVEKTMLTLVREELAPMFQNNSARQFPPPDNRVITGLKLHDTAGAKQMYACFQKKRWIPVDDELLTKILKSGPVTTYAGIRE